MSTRQSRNLKPLAGSPPRSKRNRQNRWLILSCISAFLILALAIAAWDLFRSRTESIAVAPQTTPADSRQDARSMDRHTQNAAQVTDDNDPLVDDDGQTLWASPTAGSPIELSYLPPGVQIIVAMRPAAFASHPEGEKVLASLGPLGEQGKSFFNDVLKVPHGLEQCLIGIQTTSDGRWQTTIIARLAGSPTAAEHLAAKFPDANEKTHAAATYRVADKWAYWIPDDADEKLLVVAPLELIDEIIDLDGNAPPLRREVERLLEQTDADRHFTVVIAPNFLFSEGGGLFAGEMAHLRAPLFWLLGDELSAAALSLHWDENFFVEVIAAPTLDTRPEAAARILAARVAAIPDRVENFVVGLDPHPFGRRVVARFPMMVRKVAAYSRAGVEADHAVMRCYLPGVAGHNLLMGAELTLAEALDPPTTAVAVSAPQAPAAIGPESLRDRLRQTASLSFARDTLETALEQLSTQINVDIEILGADLQAEGITKNQSFGIAMTEKPAEAILVEILRLANPDKAATGPADPRQKLVYVIAPAANDRPERVIVTTRSRVAERGDELPRIFQATAE
jgi:hypothetical protein